MFRSVALRLPFAGQRGVWGFEAAESPLFNFLARMRMTSDSGEEEEEEMEEEMEEEEVVGGG